jgi:predicted signal transduction protein with EAL and GGDEF domain
VVMPDERPSRDGPEGPGSGGVRGMFRLSGLVLQVVLCAGLVAWAAAERQTTFVAVALVLGAVAAVLLARELRARR